MFYFLFLFPARPSVALKDQGSGSKVCGTIQNHPGSLDLNQKICSSMVSLLPFNFNIFQLLRCEAFAVAPCDSSCSLTWCPLNRLLGLVLGLFFVSTSLFFFGLGESVHDVACHRYRAAAAGAFLLVAWGTSTLSQKVSCQVICQAG